MKKLLILLALLIAAPAQASLYDYYREQGLKLPSLTERRVIAAGQGIRGYTGTLGQNVALEGLLRQTGVVSDILGATPAEPTSVNQGYNPISSYTSRTTQYVSATATTIPVVSTKDLSGKQIVLANISASTTVKVYLNFEPGTSKEEPFMCTGLTATSWTNCTRGLPFQSGSEITSTTISTSHNAGATVIITNIGQFYNQFVSVDGSQTIWGQKTFTLLPYSSTSTPTDDRQLITLYQFSQATSTGGINGTTTVKGVFQAATDAQLQAGTVFGSTGAALAATSQSHNQTSTANKVPVGNGAGKLVQSWLDLTQGFTFSGGVTSTGLFVVTATSTFATSTFTSTTISSQLNLAGKNANTLVNGSNAEALHYHPTLVLASTTARTVAMNIGATDFEYLFPGVGTWTAGTNDVYHIRAAVINGCQSGAASTTLVIGIGTSSSTIAQSQTQQNEIFFDVDYVNRNSVSSQAYWSQTSSAAVTTLLGPATFGTTALNITSGFNIAFRGKCASSPSDSLQIDFLTVERLRSN